MPKHNNRTKYGKLLPKLQFINNLTLLAEAMGMTPAAFSIALGLPKHTMSVLTNNYSISQERKEYIANIIGCTVTELESPKFILNLDHYVTKLLATVHSTPERQLVTTIGRPKEEYVVQGVTLPDAHTEGAKAIGKRIRLLRVENELMSKEMAELLDLKPGHYSNLEHGRRRIAPHRLETISDLTGVSVAYLLHG